MVVTAIGASRSSLESVTAMLRRSRGEFRVRRVVFSASGLGRRVRVDGAKCLRAWLTAAATASAVRALVTEEVSPATLWARQWRRHRRRGLRGCRRRRCCLRTRHQAQRRLWTVSLALWLRLAFSWCCVVFHSGLGLGVWFGSGPASGLASGSDLGSASACSGPALGFSPGAVSDAA